MPLRRGHDLSARNDHWQGFPSANQPNNGADRDLPSQYRSGLAPRRPSCYVFRQPPGVIWRISDKVDGYNRVQSELLISELIVFCTQPHFVYSHRWEVGDVLLWDQRAVLHRGRPWPYREPRTLSSICVSTTEKDGLEQMRLSA